MNRKLVYYYAIAVLFFATGFRQANAQPVQPVEVNVDEEYQTITGFGASLAFYEGWLPAHPNRAEIYDVIFKELSLDILRVRNAYGYNENMIGYVKEFAAAAENSLGHPIEILVTSWGPPAYLKSNNDESNGGTLKYSVNNGRVEFDYPGFAQWWDAALDNYNTNGIYPKYISIQNEPDWEAFYESCLMRPSEVVNQTDTIAGYNKALDAVYDTVQQRENPPLFLGPECIGIGYNAVENYVNPLDLSKLHGIAYHLYHGAEGGTVEGDPFTSANYAKVGNFHPEVPHFQTEYSREGWFTVAGMMFQSLVQGNTSAWLYWDLVWEDAGLVDLDFPWDRNRWTNAQGYSRTKDFFVFKHYSAFIHPGWKRIGTAGDSEMLKTASFMNTSGDSAAFIAVNRSETETLQVRIEVPGHLIEQATSYTTTETTNFETSDYLQEDLLILPPRSISTVDLRIRFRGPSDREVSACAFADQAALDSVVAAWVHAETETMETLMGAECEDPQVSHNFTGHTISLCEGGSVTVDWTVNANCEPLEKMSAGFVVNAPDTIRFSHPESFTPETCSFKSQAELDEAIAAWTEAETSALGNSISGGCNPEVSHNFTDQGFSVCEGGSIAVQWTITDLCESVDSIEAVFSLAPAGELTWAEPEDKEASTCEFSNQLELKEIIGIWVDEQTSVVEAGITGGCATQVTHNYTDQAMRLCDGGTVTIEWTITGVCDTIGGLTASFVLIPPDTAVSYTAPENEVASARDFENQAAVDEAVEAWVNARTTALQQSLSGGCKSHVTHNYTEQSVSFEAGGSVTITWIISDICEAVQLPAVFELQPDTLNNAPEIWPNAGKQPLKALFVPNPVRKPAKIRIISAENAGYLLEVFDLSGQLLLKRELGFFPAGTHQVEIKRNRLENGMYLFRLTSSEGESVQGRFVVSD
jgi:glucuronoarabinoxylan endo-1,4-beta-xylanase